MSDFPIILPLATIFVGIAALIIDGIFDIKRLKRNKWRLLLFILVAATCQTVLISEHGTFVTGTGFFRGDPLTGLFATIYLAFLVVSHVELGFHEKEHRDEIYILEITLAFMGSLLFFSNHLLLLPVGLAGVTLILSAGPQLCHGVELKKNTLIGPAAIIFAASSLAILGFGGAANMHQLDLLQIPSLQLQKSDFFISWLSIFLVLLSFVGFPPTGLAFRQYRKSTWNLIFTFRASVSLLGVLLVSRWVFLTVHLPRLAGEDLWPNEIPLELCVDGLVLTILLLLSFLAAVTKQFAELVFIFTLTPLALCLLGVEDLGVGKTATIFLQPIYFLLAAPVLFRALLVGGIPVEGTFFQAKEALRKTDISLQISLLAGVCFLLPGSSPAGLRLLREILERALSGIGTHPLALPVFSASILLTVICLFRIATVFHGNAERCSVWNSQPAGQKAWTYITLAALLFLGVFPGHLYKYVVQSIEIIIKRGT